MDTAAAIGECRDMLHRLREMLQWADGYRPIVIEGRWVIEAQHHRASWEVIVEPDFEEELLVVITAYPVER